MARAPHRPDVVDPISPTAVDPRTGAVAGETLERPPRDEPIQDMTVGEYVSRAVQENTDREIRVLEKARARVRTPDGKLRRARFIGAVLGLQFEKYSIPQIAGILGVATQQVLAALRLVRQDATIAEQLKRMDEQVMPLAVDNVFRAVAEGNVPVSLKVLDGRGVFRSHKSIEAQISEQRIDIRLVVQRPAHMAPDTPLPGVKEGSVTSGPPRGLLPVIDVPKEPA